jgi:amino acid adenylation domain-containing protein/thioester reductase-like protein
MNKKNIANIYPLSPMQQGILFHTLYAPESGVYTLQTCYTFSQATNLSAFQQAWQQVTDRHPVLRTSFYFKQYKEPFQVVYKQVNLPWQHYDWRGLSEAEQQEQLEAFLQADRHQGFNLSTAPLIRCTFIQLADDTYHFIWSAHHLILDGWSTALVLQEVLATYRALCCGEDLPSARSRPYGDYIAWLQQQDLSQAQAFWQKVLKGFHAPTSLRIDRYVGSNGAASYDERSLKLSSTTTAALQSLARQHKLTLNTLLQGAWALLLSRYSGEEDVVFGATSAGRPATLAGVESMVGLFINTLPVRVQVPSQESLIPWLQKIQQRQVEAQQYEYSPLVQVQGWSDVPRDLPLFESILVFENYPIDSSLQEWATEMEIREIRSVETTNYPITVKAGGNSQLALHILFDRDRIDTTIATQILGHLKTLLEGMIANPHQSLSSLNLLTAVERHQLLVAWNETQTHYPQDKCIHHLVAAQAEQTPDAVAVVFEDQQLTYRQLNVRANQLAHYLQSLGVGAEVLVGVCMTRSLEMVVGLLGVLKAGGAYVPLDPAYPDERLAFMLDDSQASILLTQQHLVEQLGDRRIQTICLDRDWQIISQENPENPDSLTNPDNLAYVIYTSGSTGKPKGVAIEHHSPVALIDWAKTVFSPAELAGVLASTSICFDLSIFELFVPLSCGGTVILAENALSLPNLAAAEITLINTVPSAIAALLREQAIPTSVCTINLAGEPLPNDLVQQLYQLEHIQQIFNLYGPSEDTTYSTYALIARDSQAPLPIGRPISNTQVYVLDKSLQPVPIGVAGELYLSGAGLARGYLHRPELTAEKFIPNPFEESKFNRLYKTGDLVRYLPNGNLEFLGRIDSQVKIRGFRIELGEIETVLRQHPTVRDAVALAWEDDNSQRLVAYIVPQLQQAPNVMELQQFLQQKLPKYMVPSNFVVLEALPLTPNSKVNRKALPAPDTAHREQETFSPPRNSLEEKLVSIWSDILRIEQVGINDNFFHLGGHSLLVVRLFARIREAFQVDLPLQTLFEAPTVANLAERLEIARQVSSAATVTQAIALKTEAVLDPAIRLQGIPFKHTTTPACILLTGATGFVGAFLLERLLQETQADIYCLIRASNPQEGKQKIQTSLESYLLWDESQSSRIIPVVGDLSQPLLGLSEEQWRSLVERVDVIYHNGAWVHHASPYSTLKAANVLGTQEVLRLASLGKVKPVHFISTISVFSAAGDAGVKVIQEHSSLDDGQVPEGGYTQSKWVAEKLVAIARDRGLPVSIYRLGRVSGHSKTGVFNPNDFLYRLLIGCIQLGSAPDGEFLEGLLPVDYVSKAIVHLSKQQESLGKAFHLVNPQLLDLKVLFNVIRSFGYPLQQLSYDQWRSELVKIAERSPEHTLYSLVPFFPPREGADSKPKLATLQFDCQNTLNGLTDSSIFCPPTDEKLLRTYLSYLVRSNILKAPQQPGITVS